MYSVRLGSYVHSMWHSLVHSLTVDIKLNLLKSAWEKPSNHKSHSCLNHFIILIHFSIFFSRLLQNFPLWDAVGWRAINQPIVNASWCVFVVRQKVNKNHCRSPQFTTHNTLQHLFVSFMMLLKPSSAFNNFCNQPLIYISIVLSQFLALFHAYQVYFPWVHIEESSRRLQLRHLWL